MKLDIKHDKRWRYIEICDRCGKTIFGHEWEHSNEPDIQEADFCRECLLYLLDNDIPYEDAKLQYKNSI